MDFDDSPRRQPSGPRYRRWLASTGAPPVAGGRLRRRSIAGVDSPEADAHHVELCRDWQRTSTPGAGPASPGPGVSAEGGTPAQQTIFNQEQARYDVSTGVFAVAIAWSGHLIAHAPTSNVADTWIPSCGVTRLVQLFSEPGAGSDLASLSTGPSPTATSGW